VGSPADEGEVLFSLREERSSDPMMSWSVDVLLFAARSGTYRFRFR
jgi:hypothetical protein